MKKFFTVLTMLLVLTAFSVTPIFAGGINDGLAFSDQAAISAGKCMVETITIKGHYIVRLFGPDGKLKDYREGSNTVTTAGKYGVMDQVIASPTLTKMGWMAIGTGTPSGTALGSELDRNAFTTKTRSNAIVTVVGDWAAGDGTGAITEAGTFDQATLGGNMWMSSSFSVINKGASDTLSITWTLTGS